MIIIIMVDNTLSNKDTTALGISNVKKKQKMWYHEIGEEWRISLKISFDILPSYNFCSSVGMSSCWV